MGKAVIQKADGPAVQVADAGSETNRLRLQVPEGSSTITCPRFAEVMPTSYKPTVDSILLNVFNSVNATLYGVIVGFLTG